MRKLFTKLKQKYLLLINDKDLLHIFLLHLLLIALHFYEYKTSSIEYHWYLRAGGCGIISLFIFLFGRKGLSYRLLIYSCSLVYVNMFYNYATIFFMLIAIGANPKLKKVAPWIYLINVVISFSIKRLDIVAFLIHIVYVFMFQIKMNYVFAINKPEKLNLTKDEIDILKELAKGKLQKEIGLFSEQTITHKIKSARERNMCNSTGELVEKFKQENGL